MPQRVVPGAGCPSASRSTRSARATACRTRPCIVPVEVKARVHRPARRRRSDRHRGDELRAPEVGAAARRRRGADRHGWCDAARRPLPGSGAQRARPRSRAGQGLREIAIFGSATETFARRNLNRTRRGVDRDVRAGRRSVRAAPGSACARYLSMCFGDPWEGDVPIGQVVDVGARLLDLGCTQLSLGDTIGVAHAGHVTALIAEFAERGVDIRSRWPCTSTTRTARRWRTPWRRCNAGITTVDASAGGLGGCPYAKNATGNLATEDLVWMLARAGHRDRRRPGTARARPACGWPPSFGRPSSSNVVRGALSPD